MYEVLKNYTYDGALNITFHKKVIFDYDSEERYFCLTVDSWDNGTDENILLDFIYDSDEFEEKAQKIVREYLLNDIAADAECVAFDLGIEDLKIIAGEFGIATTAETGDKYFQLNDNDDYNQLKNDIIDYVKSLNTK